MISDSKIKRALIFAILAISIPISFVFDQTINFAINDYKSVYLSLFFSLITNIGIVLIVMVIIPSIISFRREKRPIFLLVGALTISTLISLLLKIIFLRERPNLDIDYETFYMLNYSFPSMHSMIAFSLVPILSKYFEKQKAFWVLCAYVVGSSRIYLGFHFLSDVVFGGFTGYLVGKMLIYSDEKYGKHKI